MCKTIKQKVKIRLSPDRIYQLLADSKLHSKLTGQKAMISKKIGGQFSTHDGRVHGVIVDLVPQKRIVQAWRSKDFPVGAYSMASFELTETKDGGTEIVLTHRGVPKALIPAVEEDWRSIYWDRLRKEAAGPDK